MPAPGVQRVGDFNSKGGLALGPGHNNVLINGRPALKPNTPFTPHIGCNFKFPIHCAGVVGIMGGSPSVRANGIPLITDGDKDSCMDARQGGSPNVRAPGGAGLGGALGSLGVAVVGALI
jgi:uncharacterized Zn-binding protein involved in type VI secretion